MISSPKEKKTAFPSQVQMYACYFEREVSFWSTTQPSNWHDWINLYWTSPLDSVDRVEAAYFSGDTKHTQK